MKDYYYILGIRKDATFEEVKKAYRKLSMKFHPDKNEGDEFFTERFKDIQEAYEVLRDIEKKQLYDIGFQTSQGFSNSNTSKILAPVIEYFNSNKTSFEYGDEVFFFMENSEFRLGYNKTIWYCGFKWY